MTAIKALLFGEVGIVRDLVAHVMREGGVQVLEDDQSVLHPEAVAVLVSPTAADWQAVERLGLRGIVVTESRPDYRMVIDAVLRGADAILYGDTAPEQLLQTVSAVAAGECVFTPTQTRLLADALRGGRSGGSAVSRLTRREVDILASVDKGESVKQTARSLGISIKTVENLQTRLFRKLGVRNRAQAVAVAHTLHLLGSAGAPVTVR